MPVDKILRGLSHFQRHVYPKHRDLFKALALAQRPEVLFITCADSRIDPSLLTQTKPGELFICRVAGNIVPPYPDAIGGVSATIEYAVAVLGIADIVVCGHTDCGVMKAVLNPELMACLPNVTAWLHHADHARRAVSERAQELPAPQFLLEMTEQNVLNQLENLRTHPSVETRLKQKNMRLHGWVYHIGPGNVTVYQQDQGRFAPLRKSRKPIQPSRSKRT